MDEPGASRSQPTEHSQAPRALSARNTTILSEAYEVSPTAVAADAATVRDWSAPWDELMVCLELRHGWGAEMAIHYLRTILVGLNATEPAS